MSPQVGHIRRAAFCACFDLKPDTLVSMDRRGDAPFLDDDTGGKHRTYTGEDVLAFELFLALAGGAIKQELAASAVRGSLAARQFLRAREAGEDVRDLHLIIDTDATRDPIFGYRETPGYSVGTSTDVAAILANASAKIGTTYRAAGRDADTIRLGLRRLVAVPIFPAYRIAVERCRLAGFHLEGRHIAAMSSEEPETDE